MKSCKLRYRFARQNAKNRLVQSGAINQYNEILDRKKVISHMNLFRDYAKENYNITADFLLFEDTNQASKVIFNDPAFRAVDVIKGVNKDRFLDSETRDYVLQAKEPTKVTDSTEKDTILDNIQKLKVKRDTEVLKVNKPEISLNFITDVKKIVNSDSPVVNKFKHDDIQDRFLQLDEFLKCV